MRLCHRTLSLTFYILSNQTNLKKEKPALAENNGLTILSKPPALPGRLPEFDNFGNIRKSPKM